MAWRGRGLPSVIPCSDAKAADLRYDQLCIFCLHANFYAIARRGYCCSAHLRTFGPTPPTQLVAFDPSSCCLVFLE